MTHVSVSDNLDVFVHVILGFLYGGLSLEISSRCSNSAATFSEILRSLGTTRRVQTETVMDLRWSRTRN